MAKSNMGGLMLAGMCEQTIVGPNLRRATLLLVHSLPPSHPLTSPIHILVLGTLFIHMLNSKRAYLSCFLFFESHYSPPFPKKVKNSSSLQVPQIIDISIR